MASSKLEIMDDKLEAFAERVNAKLKKNVSTHHLSGVVVPAEYVEDRQIEWVDNLFRKVIIITPQFDLNDLSSPKWSFINLVMLAHPKRNSNDTPFWEKCLQRNVKINVIEKNIDSLLNSSLENLAGIKIEDLK